MMQQTSNAAADLKELSRSPLSEPERIRERYNLLIQSKTPEAAACAREELRRISMGSQCEPRDLIEALGGIPAAHFLLQQDSRILERYSIEEHTSMFLGQLEKYLTRCTLPLPLSNAEIRIAGVLHDIGKPLPDDKREQHVWTLMVIDDLQDALPLSPQSLRIIRSLIGNDSIGRFVVTNLAKQATKSERAEIAAAALERGLTGTELQKFAGLVRLHPPSERTAEEAERIAQEIKLRAAALGIPPVELFNLHRLFHSADTSAYTYDAVAWTGRRACPGLEFLFKLNPDFFPRQGAELLIRDKHRGLIELADGVKALFDLVEAAILR